MKKSDSTNSANKRPSGDYPVGYCRPPKEHQFIKGQSGNAKAKGSIDDPDGQYPAALYAAVDIALRKEVKITENGKALKLSMAEVMVLKAIKDALNGDHQARRLIFSLAEKANIAARNAGYGEPVRIIITGGLPDRDQMPPPIADENPFDDDFNL